MSTNVDAEDLEATRSERLLAAILTVFLLVGSVWFYVKAADWVRDDEQRGVPTAAQQRVLDERDQAWEVLEKLDIELESARIRLDVARTDYETAVETGTDVPAAEAEYRAAQVAYDQAEVEAERARAAAQEADERATKVDEELWANDPPDGPEWLIASIRFVFITAWVMGSYFLIAWLRRRRPRYLPLGFGAAATGAVLALVFATDYVTDYIDPLDLGPIVLSLVGVAATLVAFVVLQRYLARRIPGRRVRKGECPFCGYPVRGAGPHCEGCGREVVAECATCHEPRRVGSSHCVACGAA